MSGFSRISKAEGILHFLALVKMMQNICLPIIQQNGGELVKIVGDNIFATFTSASLVSGRQLVVNTVLMWMWVVANIL